MKKYTYLLIAASVTLCACKTDYSIANETKIELEDYVTESYQITEVFCEDVEPVLHMNLEPDNREVISYGALAESMEVDSIPVEIGDKVQKGDVLVKFKSDEDEDLEDSLRKFEKRREEDELMLGHFANVSGIDKKTDYGPDIIMLQDDITLMNTYIDEINARKNNLQLIAKSDGVVTYICDDVLKGFAPEMTAIIKVTSGSDEYVGRTDDAYVFEVGDEFTATKDKASVGLRVTAIEESAGTKTIHFEKTSSEVVLDESTMLSLDIQKQVIKSAVYVNAGAIVECGEKQYVYVINDAGYRTAKEVKTGSYFGEYVIITEGLSGGEWVVLF